MKRNTVNGIILLLIAAGIIINRLGLFPHIPVGRGILSCVAIYILVRGIVRRNFYAILIPVAFVLSLFRVELGMPATVNVWLMFLTAVIAATGLTMIFGKKHGKSSTIRIETSSDDEEYRYSGMASGESRPSLSVTDGNIIHVENAMSACNQYITDTNFREIRISNSLGNANIYVSDSAIPENGAAVFVDNSLGSVNLHLPGSWNVQLSQDTSLGSVRVIEHSSETRSLSMPVSVDTSLGDVQIHIGG